MAKAMREKFRRRMSSDDLVDWLQIRGLGEGDRQKIKGRLAGYCCNIVLCFLSSNSPENGFTGESFLLLDDQTVKGIGIKVAGQKLIKKLRAEVHVCTCG